MKSFFIICFLSIVSFKASQENLVSIPLEYTSDTWNISCNFGGLEGDCFFDTGSPQNIIPGSVTEASAKFPVISSTKGGSLRSAQLMLSNFLTPVTFALRHDDDKSPDGAVGFTALGSYIWKFDLISNVLTLEQEIPTALRAGPLSRTPEGHFGVPVKIGDVDAIADFDTGTQGGAMVDISIYNSNKSIFSQCSNADMSGNQSSISIFGCQLSELDVNDIKIKNVQVFVLDFTKIPIFNYFLSSGWRALIGENVIKGHVWHFDLKENKWAIER